MRFLVWGTPSLSIPSSEFYWRIPVMYVVYCCLARDVAVSVNTNYKVGYCDCFLIEPSTEIMHDNAMF